MLIIGDGAIGLSTALEVGRYGARCHLFGAVHHEMASGAAAGLLAPSIGNLSPAVRSFFSASLEGFPRLIAELREFEPALALIEGLVDLSTEARHEHRELGSGDRLTTEQVSTLEPALFAPQGAVYHPRDAAVDNRLLVRALRLAVARSPTVTVIGDDPIVAIDRTGTQVTAHTRRGERIESSTIVLAAGAWSAGITGLPRLLPVRPLKGQMLAVGAAVIRHSVMSDDIYLVPRAAEIAIGATVEDVGFDATVNVEAIEGLRQAAIRVCPALREATVLRAWSGLRPATPDMLPILGPDPTDPRLIYACGHSKNGILLTPATSLAIAAIASGRPSSFDLAPFRVDRFRSGPAQDLA